MPTELSADEIINKMGADFAVEVKKDRRAAWRQLRDTFMTNLPTIAKSGLSQPLREMISVAMDIDKIILGGSAQGSTTEPLDAIAERWTFKDEDDDGGSSETTE